MNRPYIISEDIYLLLKRWAVENDFTLPSKEFFLDLRKEMADKLGKIFDKVELITEDTLKQGFDSFFKSNKLPVISLDRVYVEVENNLEITRIVDGLGRDLGLKNRSGAPNLKTQLEIIEANFVKTAYLQEVVLVDDVIFSGELALGVIEHLRKINIKVVVVFAGIGVAEGVKKIRNYGIAVDCVREYSEVIDEICERDFYPGVPLSGRLVGGANNVATPYILPHGKPGKWASIPKEFQKDFSKFCWQQTSRLFSAIECASQKPVRCCDLGRLILNFPNDDTRYIDAIVSVDSVKVGVE